MNNAVGLVRTYLQLNGYFTVTECPIMESAGGNDVRSATDIDIMAMHFPGAGEVVLRHRGKAAILERTTDPRLACPEDVPDMIIGEVKEGRAELNAAAHRPEVVAAAIARFGCCEPTHARHVAAVLTHDGQCQTPCGHNVHLIAFGSTAEGRASYQRILLCDVVQYIEEYLHRHWDAARCAGAKDRALGFLLLLEKARRHPTPLLSLNRFPNDPP